MRIDVLDYGVGNLASVHKALSFVGATPVKALHPDSIQQSRAILIPGVGHFESTRALDNDWRRAVLAAISRGAPVFGICLGMQWLFDGSREAPSIPGLGALRGTCDRLAGDIKVPHVGWNNLVRSHRTSPLMSGIRDGASAYFTHSYAAPVTGATVASTTHGREFASVVEDGRVFGVQWHPEKSGAVGLRMLGNFVSIARNASC
jgi:glutamine amidotransferase